MEGYRGDEKENYHMVQELGESRMGRREKNCRGNNKRIGNWLSGTMNAPRVAANLAVFEHRREPEERERERDPSKVPSTQVSSSIPPRIKSIVGVRGKIVTSCLRQDRQRKTRAAKPQIISPGEKRVE